ncbi:MAG: DegV family EDD domain-containing protein, partial [Eubacterium sp.]|nr:DegV family EDD domain-containing protein [Eubacterium sp.]
IQGSGKMLLALINDILDFSKIEAGGMEIVPVDYRVGDMLSEIVNMIWIRAQDKGLELEVSIDPSVPSVLYGDEVRIKQIIINILNNAVKYTQEGSVGLHVECKNSEENTCFLQISVTDTGMGIKKEALPYLFDAFRRVDEEKNRHIEGTGLGLSIVKELVELMGGTITVNSVYGEGSNFNISLKQEISDASEIGEISIQNYGKAKRSNYESSFIATDAAILIVDDNEMNLRVEEKLLATTQLRIDTAMSGREALEYTLAYSYDVILMDHLMPEMDGIECLEAIRKQTGGLNNSTPVIVLTANAGSDNKELYNRAGFDGYLVKPVSGESLEDTLIRHIPAEKLIINASMTVRKENISNRENYRRRLPVIVTSSSMCDLPDAIMESAKLSILPFQVHTDDGVFKDSYQTDADEVLKYMKVGRKVESSPPSVDEYVAFFAENLRQAHHLIYIAITSSMSEDYDRAREAARSFDNVTVINSESVSSATGLLVLIACKLATRDISVEEMVAELEALKKSLQCSFIIGSTRYMAAKGMISDRVSTLVEVLGIKPAIRVKDNKIGLKGAWTGGTKHAYRRYIRKAFPVGIIPDEEVVFVTYADVNEDDLLWIREEIKKHADFENVVFQKASAAISSNCGPGSFGVLYFVKSNKNYNIASLLPVDQEFFEEEAEEPEEENHATVIRTLVQDSVAKPEKADALEEPETGKKVPHREPEWYDELEGIDPDIAIKNSGSEESFRMVLKIFYDSITPKSEELWSFFNEQDWENYTIKIHALKGSAKLIGAMELADGAFELEMAGKEGRTDYITENHAGFMERYEAYDGYLKSVFAEPDTAEED